MTHYNLFKKGLCALLFSNAACFSLPTIAFCEETVTQLTEEKSHEEDSNREVSESSGVNKITLEEGSE